MTSRRAAPRVPVLAFVLALAGCAPAKLKRPPSPFPAAAKLGEIGARPVPAAPKADPIADAESWKLAGPLPETAGAAEAWSGKGPWAGAFAEALAGKPSLRATVGMECVAREMGRYELAKSGRPPEELQRYILGRCGVVSAMLTFSSTVDPIDDRVTDESAATASKDAIATTLTELANLGSSLDVGLWFGREKGRAAVVVAATERTVDLEPVPVKVTGGRVALRGTLRSAAAHVEARINRGRFESLACEADASVALPSFAFTCEADPADASAWVEVFAYPPERILGRAVAGVLVAPSGKPLGLEYRRPVGGVVAAAAGTDFAAGFLAALNAVRKDAGLLEVRATDAQTATANRVAPHYFANVVEGGGSGERTADVIALGMLAGWNVDATVHNGMLASAWTADGADPGRLLGAMLQSPSSRAVLLDRDADVIAIGTSATPETKFLGALITVYRIYEYVTPEARLKKVLERMDALRAQKGLGQTAYIKGLGFESEKAVHMVETSHLDPGIALDSFLRASTQKSRRAMRGYVVETPTLDDFRLPPDLLEQSFLPVAAAVAYHRPRGEPWGRWVVMFVTFADEKA